MTPTQYDRLDLALSFAAEALEAGDIETAAGALGKARAVLDGIEQTPAKAPEPDDDEEDNGEWRDDMTKEEEAQWSARQRNAVAEARRAFDVAELNERLAARGGRTL